MKFIKSMIDYVTTILFTLINILIVSLTIKHAKETVAQEMMLSLTIRKVVLFINIGYLFAFIFIGFPKYYKGNTKRNFKNIVAFIKNLFALANAFIVIMVTKAAINVIKLDGSLEGIGPFKKWKLINQTLKPIGINGFYTFIMYITFVVCCIKLVVWIIKFFKFIFTKKES